jgi:hypothetical protein
MIVFSVFLSDLFFHFAILVLASAYLRYLITTKDSTFIWIALVAALIITFVNHTYYPRCSLARVCS